jgi:ubiquinone biosynthesis protein
VIVSALGAASPAEILVRVTVAAVIAVVTTAISMRLLGIRRGWPTALLAGAIGWGIGGVLALGLAGWDWGAEDLVIHTLAIGIPATMAAAVALDQLARPGSLARGEQAGLVIAPQPLRAIGTRIEVFRRYRELLRIARSQGFGPFISAGARAEHATHATGERLRHVLEEAGGVYIKLGQIAATRVDLLPPEICAELARLQNQVPPEPIELIRPAIEAELGGEVETVFAEFEWEPLAAASISQTHRARLRSGEAVVVKVQRPGIDSIMQRDLAALALLANFAQSRTEVGQGLRSGELLDEFAKGLRAELDFRREADAMTEMAMFLGEGASVRVPKVYRELCGKRLLVQERFEGFTVADRDELARSTVEPIALGEKLLRCFLEQILRHGFFHADPHPGNIFVFPDGAIGLIDFGAVGRLDPIQQAAVRDMLAALATRNVSLLRDGIERVADVADAGSPDQLERALARLMAENVRPTGAVAPTVFQDLVATLSRFGIRLPSDLVVLSRAMVTLDGTLRVISPDLNLVATAATLMAPSATEPPVLDRDAMIRDELLSVLPHLRRLPDRIDRVLTMTGRGDLRIRSVVDEDSQRILRTLANRALLAFIGFALLLAGTILLVAGDPGPIVASGTGLFEIFGYGGLLAGMVLLLRVVAAVARDGTT